MFDWSDLRHLIAVSRYGSTLAAAKALGANQSTVHRRLGALEAGIGLTLVKRSGTFLAVASRLWRRCGNGDNEAEC